MCPKATSPKAEEELRPEAEGVPAEADEPEGERGRNLKAEANRPEGGEVKARAKA